MDHTVEVRLYGEFREKARPLGAPKGKGGPVRLAVERVPSLSLLLERLEIRPGEVGSVFLNGRLLHSISPMQVWLMYPTERERIPEGGGFLDARLRSGDRIGLFPRRMGLLVI